MNRIAPMTASATRRVALNVSGFALLLASVKGAAGFAAGSIALLSSPPRSAGDMLASFANFLFLTIAAKPPDACHHFGHCKAASRGAAAGTIILGSAALLGTHAIERIRRPVAIEASFVAIGVMVLSIFATI